MSACMEQVIERLWISGCIKRLPRCLQTVVNRFFVKARLAKMPGKFGGTNAGIAGRGFLHRLGDIAVKYAPSTHRNTLVHCLLHQWVMEGVAVRSLLQESHGGHTVEQIQQLPFVMPIDRLKQPILHIPPRRGAEEDKLTMLGRHAADPLSDQRAHAVQAPLTLHLLVSRHTITGQLKSLLFAEE